MHPYWGCCAVQVSPHLGTETPDNWSIQTSQSLPCCWCSQECSRYAAAEFQRDASLPGHPTPLPASPFSPQMLFSLKQRSHRPLEQQTHIWDQPRMLLRDLTHTNITR